MEHEKLGIGLYREMLDREHFRFARQCGCTHLIIHLARYYTGGQDRIVTATDEHTNYGRAVRDDPIWSYDSLCSLQNMAAEEGLVIEGIENFDPADWYDILLDGPGREQQMEHLKQIIRVCGKAGIHVFGYNFSLAGVWGHQKKHAARGNAVSTCFDASLLDINSPIPHGDVWNMTYAEHDGTCLAPISSEELWERLRWFLDRILPVAEESGVVMALHPDDPVMPELRRQPRLVYQPEHYRKLIEISASPANQIEFCMGSIQEMSHGSLYDAIQEYGSGNRIAYIHFRNVRGKVPCYDEVFLDEGDIDMLRALRLLRETGFHGVMIPDHTPLIDCGAPWYAGMAFALGYMRAAQQALDKGMI